MNARGPTLSSSSLFFYQVDGHIPCGFNGIVPLPAPSSPLPFSPRPVLSISSFSFLLTLMLVYLLGLDVFPPHALVGPKKKSFFYFSSDWTGLSFLGSPLFFLFPVPFFFPLNLNFRKRFSSALPSFSPSIFLFLNCRLNQFPYDLTKRAFSFFQLVPVFFSPRSGQNMQDTCPFSINLPPSFLLRLPPILPCFHAEDYLPSPWDVAFRSAFIFLFFYSFGPPVHKHSRSVSSHPQHGNKIFIVLPSVCQSPCFEFFLCSSEFVYLKVVRGSPWIALRFFPFFLSEALR